VTLVGRWSELAPAAQDERPAAARGPRTPLAVRPVALRIEDARGPRRMELSAVPGQRYSIGKDAGSAGCPALPSSREPNRRA